MLKKVLLKISENSQENTCPRASFLLSCRPQTSNFIKKEALAQIFYCEFSEIFETLYRTTLGSGQIMLLEFEFLLLIYLQNLLKAL